MNVNVIAPGIIPSQMNLSVLDRELAMEEIPQGYYYYIKFHLPEIKKIILTCG